MKQTSLQMVAVTANGSIELTYGLDIVEGGKVELSTPLRRIVNHDGDLDANLDDIDTYLVDNGYPALNEDQRNYIYGVDANARANPAIEAARAAAPPTNQPLAPEVMPLPGEEEPPPSVN